jgi:hypothetical protein
MNLENSMTRKTSRVSQQTGTLKAILLTGSVMATLAGTRLLALQEPVAADTPAATNESATVVVPENTASSIPLPPTMRGTQVELKPIPQVVQPKINPVARTRSSR